MSVVRINSSTSYSSVALERLPECPFGEIGDPGTVEPEDCALHPVLQRPDEVLDQRLGAVHGAEGRAGRRAVAVGVPPSLNRQPDSPGVVSLTPEQRGGDYRSVVYGVYPAVVAVRFFQFVARRLPAEPMVPQGDHMP